MLLLNTSKRRYGMLACPTFVVSYGENPTCRIEVLTKFLTRRAPCVIVKLEKDVLPIVL